MTPREHVLTSLRLHEGFRGTVYDDATGRPLRPGDTLIGHPTVGYGHALDVHPLTKAQANVLLASVVDEFDDELRRRVTPYIGLNDARQMVLLEMGYSLGVDGLLHFTRMLRAIGNRNWTLAGVEMWNSTWASQVGSARVRALASQLDLGVFPDAAPLR